MKKTKPIEELEQYDKVLLKTGETASIVEIYGDGKVFDADVDKADGTISYETIWPKDIDKVFVFEQNGKYPKQNDQH